MRALPLLLVFASSSLADVVTTSLPALPHSENVHLASYCFNLTESIEVTMANGDALFGTADVDWCYTSTGVDWWSFEDEMISITGSIAGMDFEFIYDETIGHPDDNLEAVNRGSPFHWNHQMTFAFQDVGPYVARPLAINGQELFGVTAGSVQFTREELSDGVTSATWPGRYVEYMADVNFDYSSDSGDVRRFRSTSGPVTFSAVPEPSAFMMLGCISILAAASRWRQRINSATLMMISCISSG